jgi:prepilin-type processing-associated H-X9-DG protein
LVDPNNNVSPTAGIISPYYEANSKVLMCPSLPQNLLQQQYSGQTGGYGYNRCLGTTYWVSPNWSLPRFLTRRLVDFSSTSATFVFADSALISTWPAANAQESYSMAAPYTTAAQPTTHFRHSGKVAAASFLDGHVEIRTEVDFPDPASWAADASLLRKSLTIGYLSNSNIPYDGMKGSTEP